MRVNSIIILFFVLLIGGASQGAFAAEESHHLIRRVVVFPFMVPERMSQEAEKSWWNIRDILTKNKRFLIGSRRFLDQKDVFQARRSLEPVDAIILGRLLDAHALIVVYLEGRNFHMKAYEGKNGRLLWEQKLPLHSAQPMREQVGPSSEKLILDFVASIPYHGYVIKDPFSDKVEFIKKEIRFIRANVGQNAQVSVGDPVQLVNLKYTSLNALLLDDNNLRIFGEGEVQGVQDGVIRIKVFRTRIKGEIPLLTLVRLPKNYTRLQNAYALRTNPYKNIDQSSYRLKENELTKSEKENKPLLTSVAFLGNILTLLLLAF